MTILNKPIQRRVPRILPRQQDLTVSLIPGGFIGFREARSRREYRIPILTVYRMAIEAARGESK